MSKKTKSKKAERVNENKAKQLAIKMLAWIGMLYGIGMIKVFNQMYLNAIGGFLNQSELLNEMMSVRLIPIAEFLFNPIKELVVYLPFALIIVIVPSLVYYLLNKVKILEKKEVLLFTALTILTFFL